MSERLWVMTPFFNPTGHLWRQRNLRAFRRHLNAPLLVVELAEPENRRLGTGDADKLVALSGDSRIWQKERLLNIGVSNLPPEVEYIAWIDCDIVFERPDWMNEAMAQLRSGKQFVQLFDAVARLPELPPEALDDVDTLLATSPVIQKPSFASMLQAGRHSGGSGSREPHGVESSEYRNEAYKVTHGVAWATHRELLEDVGLYDACITGGGPSAMALAITGRPNSLGSKRPMSPAHYRHYLAWAKNFRNNSSKDVGFVPGTALHLWHGPYENRRYHNRHVKLAELGFNPEVDLEMAENGTWRWAPHAAALQSAVTEYFASRSDE